MSQPMQYSFQRYLLAKQGLDNRSLNNIVSEQLAEFCAQAGMVRALELGAGVGTMLERLAAKKIITKGEYIGLDADAESVAKAMQRTPEWALRQGFESCTVEDELILDNPASGDRLRIDFRVADAIEFCQRQENVCAWDLLIANAFLDLFNLDDVLPVFLQALHNGGGFYLTLNFDGMTIFEPQIDACLDELIITLYHRSMDERKVNGLLSGDSRSGRHLFSLLPKYGSTILEAGSSDWVVYPGSGGYPGDEAYFLHHILHFFEQSLYGHPELDVERFDAWLNRRHVQVECGELVFVAHQIDFFGKL
jgi:hypothetical protein